MKRQYSISKRGCAMPCCDIQMLGPTMLTDQSTLEMQLSCGGAAPNQGRSAAESGADAEPGEEEAVSTTG